MVVSPDTRRYESKILLLGISAGTTPPETTKEVRQQKSYQGKIGYDVGERPLVTCTLDYHRHSNPLPVS
jgi:hypothetical protein